MAQSEYLSWFLNTLMIKDLRENKTRKFTILSTNDNHQKKIWVELVQLLVVALSAVVI